MLVAEKERSLVKIINTPHLDGSRASIEYHFSVSRVIIREDIEELADLMEILDQPSCVSVTEDFSGFPRLGARDMIFVYWLLDKEIDKVDSLIGFILDNFSDLVEELENKREKFSWKKLFLLAKKKYFDYL